MEETAGYIYILTNPSFPEYVKIGYADDVEKRLNQLNRTECTPFAFRLYATYEVPNRLADKKLHSLLDMFDANLRAVDELNGKKRVKEFYAMQPDKAYHALELIAELTDTTDRLILHEISSKDKTEDELANSIRRPKFTFKNLGIKPGEFLEYIHDPTIKVKVLNDDRLVEYEGKEYHLSNLAQQLLGRPSRVQGPLHFSYKGEVLTELRDRLENK
ncbi:MAG: GIY-YIG nuclease family protein [Bacteroidales bacterium]|nr:GIY-YIG nuclease family protein [Bacteroidales bacterium]